MKQHKFLLALLLFFGFFACEDMDDKPVASGLEINDFIWKGLNLYYYWQADSPDLADNRFEFQNQFEDFLRPFSPEDLFEHLLVERTTDRFSVIFSDYTVLEGALQGNTKNNGVDFVLNFVPGSTTQVFGWVRYIIPNSDASSKPIQRGDIFYAVNGVPLTSDNFRSLLAPDNYTLNLADFDGTTVTSNGISVELTKTVLTENPILVSEVFEIGERKIGYLVYNGFFANFESQLNTVFANFLSAGVTDLVLDLRYNSGGSVATATRLASMITGQFHNEIFGKQEWNQKVMTFFNDNNPEQLINRFTNTINNGSDIQSLQLNKLYVLTTRSSASASELVINGLKPYIDVVQIGTTTSGKNVGSITLYDAPTFGTQNRNPSHKYAMQPITFKIVNRDNFGDYQDGLQPNVVLPEDISNLGVLGDVNEPLLSAAIAQITGNGRFRSPQPVLELEHFKDSKDLKPIQPSFYLNQLPEGMRDLLR
jgi:carboxyl-terminal processing protease